ncbi:hypothetical protein P5673_018277 [Acropora cervicornis]|uniref:Uncharacterized protein n=1 Tax=Acropora cervicornis TaxID=6130 RepID=A0AAD9QD66_ACRCE|nr:hypothetical protein P5673_018277 [Acropora cervicornis]
MFPFTISDQSVHNISKLFANVKVAVRRRSIVIIGQRCILSTPTFSVKLNAVKKSMNTTEYCKHVGKEVAVKRQRLTRVLDIAEGEIEIKAKVPAQYNSLHNAAKELLMTVTDNSKYNTKL